ncbi:S8 family serine peptidase [Pararhodobacter zhoushanensis]|uniref:S8 family serine peptidase n=1 Tax=Pararhodobacter zhoushanensis TaxID=2479545 RepID=UPI000F8E4A18|nr:S8 family serine peptidase [Pararhodobacter zhoushanensis]
MSNRDSARRGRPSLTALVSVVLMLMANASAVRAQISEYPPTGYEVEDHFLGGEPVGGHSSRPIRVQRTEGARYEWIVIGPQSEAAAVLRAIEESGGRVIRSSELDALGQTQHIAIFPSQDAYDRTVAALRALAPQSSMALHHIFGFAQSTGNPRIYAPTLIGDAAPGRCRVSGSVTIGMIDGPVNPDHPALSGASVRYETLVDSHNIPQADHGTAVAVLMVGQDPSGLLSGFAQGARLDAVSVFASRDGTEEANVERIVTAIDHLVGRGVQLINLSLAGPQNEALGRAITAAAAHGAILIAASGNERRPVVAWPAAAPEVIAVTAIDAARRRFRMANTGAELEFAAPGVDVYAARTRGAGYVSGTSFAAPIVTALAARHMAQGAGSAEAVRAALRGSVETLGPGTRNTDFGYGLVRSGGC